jgi:hypothetical protein
MKLLRLAILLLALASPTALRSKPLNVLVLYADDWRHDTLACAGNAVSAPAPRTAEALARSNA